MGVVGFGGGRIGIYMKENRMLKRYRVRWKWVKRMR